MNRKKGKRKKKKKKNSKACVRVPCEGAYIEHDSFESTRQRK